MTAQAPLTLSWTAVITGAVALLAVGSAATYLIGERSTRVNGPVAETDAGVAPSEIPALGGPSNEPVPDVALTLSQEAVARAGITVAPVTSGSAAARIRIPAVVQANAYRQVAVTPLVEGRVTRVSAELGDRVRRGQTLLQLYSPELAEAQTQYVSWSGELEAAQQEMRRTERLVEIGAASRQELEKVRAEHTTHATHVESARAKLVLLGMTSDQVSGLSSATEITATANVPAPIDGVITERTANIGLNVDPSAPLFTIVDLSTVWIVGNLYEKDFALVREGTAATMTTAAFPELALQGQVSYIDPQINSATRTMQLRVELDNPGGRLRPGMYADLQLEGATTGQGAMVPGSAVQNVGDRQVVYLVDPKEPGRFVEREVRLGSAAGDQVQVIDGIQPGDVVVTAGSFFLRAERERLGRND